MALSKLTDIRKSLSVEVEDLQVNGITTFTGSVSIGGTLTYQDVTNIDSVGLITARAGVNVSGGQLDVGSNIKLGNAGVITATSFTGSGANLTSLPAANLTGTLPAIDGSNLTGIDADKIQEGNSFAEILDTGTNGIFRFLPENSEVFRITHEAKVGINTNNPSHNLDISADGVAFPSAAGSTILRLRNSAGSATISIDANAGNVSAIQFGDTAAASQGTVAYNHSSNHLQFNTGGSERFRIDSGGRVMIGDTNTNNAFSGGDSLVIGNTPSGTRSGITLVSNSSTDGGIYFSTGSSNQTMGQVVYNHPDNSLRFYANNSQRFRIKSDGSVAIAGDNVNISTDTAHTVNLNEKLCVKNRYVDASATEINLDTSGNLGQSLNLNSHSSATDHFAMLTFDSGSLKSGIAGGRPNAGNWGTDLRFYTHPNATSNVHKTYERMRIDNEGAISLRYGRVNDAGHQTYRYGGRIAGTATVSVNIPVFSDGNIYWIEAFYTHHSLSYGGYLYGVYGAYSGHNGLQINNTIGSSTAGGGNAGTWSVSRGNAGQPVVVAKSAGSYGGQGHWWIHVHAGTTPNL